MRIGILTHYDVNNLGAQLQMYAMYRQLESMGHSPVVLTYSKNFDFAHEQKLRNQITVKSIPYITKEFVIKKGIRQTWHNTRKYHTNKKFRNKIFQMDNYATADIDAVIVGADEVFSIGCGINMMMYGHGMLTENCIAYAPAFGETDIKKLEKHHATALISSGINCFKALSARDVHTQNMIRQLTGKEAPIVCDPVILYKFSDAEGRNRKIKQPYIAIYSYDRNMVDSTEVAEIKRFAKSRNLITVSVGNFHKWCDKNVVCNCIEWLDYMRNAEMVITDTFHGTVVSSILHKETAVMTRSINQNKLSSLLKELNLESRQISKISSAELEKVFGLSTDFQGLEQKLEKLREISDQYLKGALTSVLIGENYES